MFWAATAQAQSLRIATFNTELSRKGPGLLLRDVLRADDPQIMAALDQIAQVRADVIALQGFDFDLTGAALNAFAEALSGKGMTYPYRFALPGNAGLMTDFDLDGDGKLRGPGDAQGYGAFFGEGGMALLSRYPIDAANVRDFTPMMWRDLPEALLPQIDGQPFPSGEAQGVQRLSSNGHWVVPVEVPRVGTVHVLSFHATPPVFDGPEDRNGRRNHDEVVFWDHYLNGVFGDPVTKKFVLLGAANLDPDRGDGRGSAMRRLLAHPMLQDPLPNQATVNWRKTGPMRVDYVLPSRDWQVLEADITDLVDQTASRHGVVWVDIAPR